MACESEHFSKEELQCSHCGECHMDAEFLEMLEEIREAYGGPIHVTSGYRCPEYNNTISNTGTTGPHTTGKAVDVKVYGKKAYKLVNTAMYHGVTGIGIHQHGPHEGRFIHLDIIHSNVRPWIWSY